MDMGSGVARDNNVGARLINNVFYQKHTSRLHFWDFHGVQGSVIYCCYLYRSGITFIYVSVIDLKPPVQT